MRMLKLEQSSGSAGRSLPELSPRQLECLTWAEEGKSARDTGQILGISRRTVEKHLEQAYEALGVRTRIQAVVRARQLGLLAYARAFERAQPTGTSTPNAMQMCASSVKLVCSEDLSGRRSAAGQGDRGPAGARRSAALRPGKAPLGNSSLVVNSLMKSYAISRLAVGLMSPGESTKFP